MKAHTKGHKVGGAHYTHARCTHHTQIEICKQEALLKDPTHGIGSAHYTHVNYAIHENEVHIIQNVLSLQAYCQIQRKKGGWSGLFRFLWEVREEAFQPLYIILCFIHEM